MSLFDPQQILTLSQVSGIQYFPSIDSTNQYLLQHTDYPSGYVCIAEQQTAGRGRNGRVWVSPPTGNLYLSLLWHFPLQKLPWSSLSLVVGVAVAKALAEYPNIAVNLKWPNDVMVAGNKLAGILVETLSRDKMTVVIGLGLNIHMPTNYRDDIQKPITDLASLTTNRINPNLLVATILKQLVTALELFAKKGFAPFIADWESYHANQGALASVSQGNTVIEGKIIGINAEGALLLQQGDIITPIYSGEPSVKLIK